MPLGGRAGARAGRHRAGGDSARGSVGEVLLVADHNSYHIGEFAILRQVMGTWPGNR